MKIERVMTRTRIDKNWGIKTN